MAIARRYYESVALANALEAYLTTAGQNLGTVRRGFQSEESIAVPMVAVHFLPSGYIELQLGRSITTDKSFERRVQVDLYLETEQRADALCDVVADFFDELYINVTDVNGDIIAHLYCPDSETISMSTTPPIFKQAKILRWRGVVQATLQADYLV